MSSAPAIATMPCPVCRGTGVKETPFGRLGEGFAVREYCHTCRGSGKVLAEITEDKKP